MPQENVEIPITGKILRVNIKVGDEVKEGDIICLLESMKMEIPILVPVDGTATKLEVSEEQIVKPGDLLAVIEY
jgi:biotin carboxyl carrier protein